MVLPRRLTLIGYWRGSDPHDHWPDPEDFVDPGWDVDERRIVTRYLQSGLIAKSFMGYSSCRFCGRNNGNLELSDGEFIWPEGLAHYVDEHDVRLPAEFVAHALQSLDDLERAERDDDWWRRQPPFGHG